MKIHPPLIISILLTACSPLIISTPLPASIPIPSSHPTITPSQGGSTTMAPSPSTPVTPYMKKLIDIAKEDLAKRLSITTTQINLINANDVVWSNSSLGCPQPGIMYAEVLTPGYLILLHVEGQDYEYHAGKNSDPFLCENPTPPVPGMPGDN